MLVFSNDYKYASRSNTICFSMCYDYPCLYNDVVHLWFGGICMLNDLNALNAILYNYDSETVTVLDLKVQCSTVDYRLCKFTTLWLIHIHTLYMYKCYAEQC